MHNVNIQICTIRLQSFSTELNNYLFDLSLRMNENKTDCKNDSKTLKIKADQNPDTLKPSTKLPAIKIITALITNRKRPKVKIVAGNVNNINSGFTVIRNNPKTTATHIAELSLPTETPGRT